MSEKSKEVKLTELEKKILKQLAPVRKMWEDGVFDPLPEKFRPSPKTKNNQKKL